MKRLLAFIAILTILVSFASCDSDNDKINIIIENKLVSKPQIIEDIHKYTEEELIDYTKFYNTEQHASIEEINYPVVPTKPENIYFNEIGCEWMEDYGNGWIIHSEGQYIWLYGESIIFNTFYLTCVDLERKTKIWVFNSDHAFDNYININRENLAHIFPTDYIVFQDDCFILVNTYYGDQGEKTIFGPIDKCTGQLLWTKFEHQRIENFHVMPESNKFIYKKIEKNGDIYNTLRLDNGDNYYSCRYKFNKKEVILSNDFKVEDEVRNTLYSDERNLYQYLEYRISPNVSKFNDSRYLFVINRIPTDSLQEFWSVSYLEDDNYAYDQYSPRILNNTILIPDYFSNTAHFIFKDNGKFVYDKGDILSYNFKDTMTVIQADKLLIIDNSQSFIGINENNITKILWEIPNEDNLLEFVGFTFNNNILFQKYIDNEKMIVELKCFNYQNGQLIWTNMFNDLYSDYKKLTFIPFKSNDLAFNNKEKLSRNDNILISKYDQFILIDKFAVNSLTGKKILIENTKNSTNLIERIDDISGKRYFRDRYYVSDYLIKLSLPTRDKLIFFPPIQDMLTENNPNKLDQKAITIINTFDKQIELSLKLQDDINFSRDNNKFNFKDYLSLSTNKLILKPFSKTQVYIKELKETNLKNNNEESLILMSWLIIKYENIERKILIKVNEPYHEI